MKISVCALGGLLLVISGCATAMSKYDSPKYTTLEIEDGFQIRRYEEALLAETSNTTENGGFRRIFKYISGENSTKENIAMTVPVRMTAAGAASMSFFMPHKYNSASLPQPQSPDVRIKQFAGGLFAANRFSGTTGTSKVEEKQRQLIAWIKSKGYEAGGEWYLDRYDPPWTLWFNRTNEVVVKLKQD